MGFLSFDYFINCLLISIFLSADIFLKVVQAVMALVLIGSLFALLKAILLWRTKAVTPASTTNSPNDQLNLTNRQLGLLGLKPKFQQVEVKSAKEASNAKANASPADKLIPLTNHLRVRVIHLI